MSGLQDMTDVDDSSSTTVAAQHRQQLQHPGCALLLCRERLSLSLYSTTLVLSTGGVTHCLVARVSYSDSCRVRGGRCHRATKVKARQSREVPPLLPALVQKINKYVL